MTGLFSFLMMGGMKTLHRHNPRRQHSAETLAQVMAAARKVFAQCGYENATVAEIGQTAGVSEATVFTYFSSKRALCGEVIRSWYDEVIERMDQRLAACPEFEARMRCFVESHLSLFMEDGRGMCALVLSEARLKGRGLDEVIRPQQRAYASRLRALLQQGIEEGKIRPDVSINTMQAAIFGLIEHLLWSTLMSSRSADLDQTSGDVWRLISRSMVRPD